MLHLQGLALMQAAENQHVRDYLKPLMLKGLNAEKLGKTGLRHTAVADPFILENLNR
jgi:hypothetical protein